MHRYIFVMYRLYKCGRDRVSETIRNTQIDLNCTFWPISIVSLDSNGNYLTWIDRCAAASEMSFRPRYDLSGCIIERYRFQCKCILIDRRSEFTKGKEKSKITWKFHVMTIFAWSMTPWEERTKTNVKHLIHRMIEDRSDLWKKQRKPICILWHCDLT